MLSKIREDAKTAPKTFGYKLDKGLATLSDEEEACTKPEYAYGFAKDVPGANIEKCQEAACQDPHYAYYFAKDIPGADIEKCQEAVCKDPFYAYLFAKNITGTNIEK
ncbi:MAG: hypothetical protein WC942_06585, partial [Clostridia bacterium]